MTNVGRIEGSPQNSYPLTGFVWHQGLPVALTLEKNTQIGLIVTHVTSIGTLFVLKRIFGHRTLLTRPATDLTATISRKYRRTIERSKPLYEKNLLVLVAPGKQQTIEKHAP
jgi:hypothetical protein